MKHSDEIRLRCVLGSVTPLDKLAELDALIFAERDCNLEEAQMRRLAARQAGRSVA